MKTLMLPALLLLLSYCAHAQDLKIMSYNIRFDNPADGENKWSLRRDFLARQIQFYAPDFIGTQEGKLHQLQYLDSTLTDFAFIGIGRDNSPNQGEFSALFYNEKKFKVITQSTFWLSETPDRISKGWDAMFERICTYGLFEDIRTKKRFYVFNTHLDHVGVTARANSAKLIADRITAINKQKLPLILTGDFNSETNSDAYIYLVSKLDDTKTKSKQIPFGPTGTFNSFEFHKPVSLLIDYIFTTPNNFDVLRYAVLSDSKDCKYPSDHLPVYVELSIRK
jgi:endonuclease/exonuclease/phosphatase family metal-dependent hydrolase